MLIPAILTALQTQILDHNVPEKRDNEVGVESCYYTLQTRPITQATTVLQLQNQELQDTVGEYKTTLDIIIDKHLTQMVYLLYFFLCVFTLL